jgi:hypothetical protein
MTKAGARVFVVENEVDKRFLIRFGQGFNRSNVVTAKTAKRRYFTRQPAAPLPAQSIPALPEPVPLRMPDKEKLLIDIPTAAQKLSTTTFAVRELCRCDKIKYVTIGHKWLISIEALQEFIRKTEAYHSERAS